MDPVPREYHTGNNAAMTAFEAQVIALYDQGALTLAVLDVLGETWRGSDIDSGGLRDIQTSDGKYLAQVCVELLEPGFTETDGPEDAPWEGNSYPERFRDIATERWGWC